MKEHSINAACSGADNCGIKNNFRIKASGKSLTVVVQSVMHEKQLRETQPSSGEPGESQHENYYPIPRKD